MSFRDRWIHARLAFDELKAAAARSFYPDDRCDRYVHLGRLEDRVLLSASPVAIAATPEGDASQSDAVSDASDTSAALAIAEQDHTETTATAGDDTLTDVLPTEQDGLGLLDSLYDDLSRAFEVEEQPRHELVIVDESTADYQQLVADLTAEREDGRRFDVIVLDGARDGVAQISERLADYHDLSAVHIVSHGISGAVKLGNVWLTPGNVSSYSSQLVGWRGALAADADLLFYGCNVASGQTGQELVQSLSALTGTDVAASTNMTGYAALFADWVWEYSAGTVESSIAFTDELQQRWSHVLAVAVDATSTGQTTGSSVTISHTTSGDARVMLVGVSMANPGARSVQSITYNGEPLTLVGTDTNGSNEARVEIWTLVAPNTGTHDLVVTLTAANTRGTAVGVMTFTGADQTTPLGTFASAGGDSSNPTVDVNSAVDELVFGAITVEHGDDYSLTPGAGQSEYWDLYESPDANSGGATKAGAATVTVSWSFGASNQWAVAAVPIKPVPPGITVTPTSGLTTTEAGGTATFNVVLDTQPTADVTIGISSSDTSEGTVVPTSLTFTSANWNVAQTVTVTGVDDFVGDRDIGYTIVTDAAISPDANYNGRNASDVTVTNTDDDVLGSLWLSTVGAVTGSGAPGLGAWSDGEALHFGDPNLALEPGTTGGTFASIFNLDSFASDGNADVDAIHYVSQDITVGSGANTMALLAGDVLLSTDVSETLTSNNTLSVTRDEVFVFRPTTPGDYSNGMFLMLLDDFGSIHGGSDTWSIALIEQTTIVGDATLDAGTFLFSRQGGSEHNDVRLFTPTGVGAGTTSGSVAVLLEGVDLGYTTKIFGLDIVEATTAIGDAVLPAGSVLIALEQDDNAVGSNNLSVTKHDVFFLTVSQTTLVSGSSVANATLLFQGADVGLDSSTEALDGLAVLAGTNPRGITITPVSGLVTTESAGTATFSVVLDSQPTADVTIALSSSDTTEGTVGPGSLTFTAANWNVAQTVTATGVDDALDDGDMAYTIITAAAASADANYNGLDAADVSVTNTDDDTAGITVSPTSGLVTTESGGTATFTVVLDTQPTADVTITLSSSDTTEGTVGPGSLTFTSANWNAAQTVTITGVDDSLDDGDMAYTIITAAATSADANYNGLDAADVSVTNTDNDTAGITVSPTSGLVTTESGGTATFSVVLDTQPTADVTIALSSSDTAEGTVAPTSLTFTSANWNAAQTVTITGVDDSLDDGDMAYTIITAAATSADANYNGLNAADVSVTNTDDDAGGITVSPTSGLVTTESGGTATFTVVLDTQPTADVTIALSSSDTTEGTVWERGFCQRR